MRNYKRKPNRFSLQMLYNGELIVTTNRYGKKQKAQRDFDSSFNEPYHLGKNPYNDKTMLQDEKNNPHKFELNAFENSWESVELGDELTELFRLILRDGTESYYQDRYNSAKNHKDGLKNLKLAKPNGGGNYYTIVIIDNKSLKRKPNGSMHDIAYLKTEYDVLVQKDEFENLSKEESRRLNELEKEIAKFYTKRVIFEHSFSADEYSYDGTDFTPPLPLIWKDFNVEFDSSYKGEDIEYADISEFNSIRNKVSNLKENRENILNALNSAQEQRDSIRVASLEKELDIINSDLHYYKNIYFRGIRSITKHYLNLDRYTNRFIHSRPRHNNFYASSSEREIGQKSFVV
jgi:hypothetical protein